MHWNKRWFQLTILLILAFVWGSSFILMKMGLKSFSNNQAASIRVLFASLALLPISLHHLRKLKRKDVKSLLIAGILGSFIPAYLFMKAETRIESGMAGILNSLTPVFTMLVGLLFYHTNVKRTQLIGVLIGLVGAVGLISVGDEIDLRNINSYSFFIVLATLCYGTSVNEIKSRLSHMTGAQVTSLYLFFLWPAALIVLATSDLHPAFETKGWLIHLGALAVLGVVGTALALLVMNSLIRYTTAVFSTSVTYIIPIFAIFWGILDGEKIRMMHFVFMAVILAGVYLINRSGKTVETAAS